MQKQAPTLGRLLVMVGFALSCFGLLLFLWLAFGGPIPLKPKGYRFNTSFGEATQLAKEADVRISGVPVGKVKTIETQPDGRSKAVIEIEPRYAPFAKDTTSLLRVLNSQAAGVRQLVRNTGEVFDALSQRDHQLQSLIVNSNNVFATTAARDAELSEIFHVLPTFENESKVTVEDLADFARNTNPLITQLRPAARELSPTLISLSNLAPDAKALFRDLDKLTRASRRGLPATEKFLDELHPLLPEFDPVLRQVNPILTFLGAYKPEINAFFANTVATTQAANVPTYSKGQRVHYLRTLNPFNPENLAVYPRRIGTNRPNPYTFPGHFLKFADLLAGTGVPPQYETRHCGNGVPTVVDTTVLDPLSGLPLIGKT